MATKKKKRVAKKTPRKKVFKKVVKQTAKKPTAVPFTCAHCGGQFADAVTFSNHMSQTKCGEHLKKTVGRSFSEHVEVDPPTDEQAAGRCEALVVKDSGGRTAIELRRSEGTRDKDDKLLTHPQVTFIPYLDSGLAVERMDEPDFNKMFTPIPDYPTGRAAKLYVGFSQTMGGTTEALTELSKLVNVSQQEINIANEKLATNKGKRTITKVVQSSKGEVEMTVTKKARNSAASMFKGLIMEGKLTDDQIFAKVQKAFDLDDSKRSYVSWYRNALKKDGKKPPKSKISDKITKKVAKKTTKKKAKKKKKR